MTRGLRDPAPGRRSTTKSVQLLAEEREYRVDGHLRAVGGHGRVPLALELHADEGVAQLGGERLEALADRRVGAVAHAQDLLAGGAPTLDDVEVGGGEVDVARPRRADRERRARLAQHRR